MPTDFSSQILQCPLDDDGFVRSFDVEDENGIKDFLNEYGFVTIKDVLTTEQCDATIDEFWESNESQGLKRDDPSTWEDFWNNQRFSRFAIIGLMADFSKCQLENRQNEKLYKACKTIYGKRNLIVDHDRLGIMRPTKNNPEWKTISNWLHLDCNPLSGNPSIGSFSDDGTPVDFDNQLIGQSLFALTNQLVEDGGFHCVPGSHKFSKKWASENQFSGSSCNMNVPKDDHLHDAIQQIPLRKGSFLFWTSLLFHGNHPNDSEQFRGVQYIRLMPTGMRYSPMVTDDKWFPNDFKVTPHGRNVFGFEPYS